MNKIKPILINDRDSAYGGKIYKISFSAEYYSPSTLDIEIFSSSGSYTITDDDLSTEKFDKISIPYESAGTTTYVHIKMLPVKYEINNDSGIKFLKIVYVDASKLYLDKRIVMLYGQHAFDKPTRTLVVGEFYEYINGVPTKITVDDTAEKTWTLAQEYDTMYRFSNLKTEIEREGIPTSKKFKAFSPQDISQVSKSQVPFNYYRNYSGSLREVLDSWAKDFGVLFYWNAFSTNNPEGELEILMLGDQEEKIKKLEFDTIVKRYRTECSITSLSTSSSIQDTFLNVPAIRTNSTLDKKGQQTVNLKAFPLNCVEKDGASTVLKDIDGEFVTLNLRSRDKNGKFNTSTIPQDAKDLQEIMAAVALGPEFYRYYVMLQGMLYSYQEQIALDIERYGLENRAVDTAMNDIDKKYDSITEALFASLKRLGNSSNVFDEPEDKGLKVNALLIRLYKLDSETVVYPLYARSEFPESFLDDAKLQTHPLFSHFVTDAGKDKEFVSVVKGDGSGMCIFHIKNPEKLTYLINGPIELDPVYLGIKLMLEVSNKWYYSEFLMTQRKKSILTFKQDVEWIYAGLGIIDTPLSYFYLAQNDISGEKSPKKIENSWSVDLANGEAGKVWNSFPNIEKYRTVRKDGDNKRAVTGYESIIAVSDFLSEKIKQIREEGLGQSQFDGESNFNPQLGFDPTLDANAKSCTTEGYNEIQSIRENKLEDVDSESVLSTKYRTDMDWGILLLKKEKIDFQRMLEDNSVYSLNVMNNKSSGGNGSNDEIIFYTRFNPSRVFELLELKAMIEEVFFDASYTFIQGLADKEWVDDSDYGIVKLGDIKNKNLSNVNIIDEMYSQEELLELMPHTFYLRKDADKAKRAKFLKEGVNAVADSHISLSTIEPSYAASATFNGLPDFRIIPSIDQGMESWAMSYGEDNITFSVNFGNAKRIQEKLENKFRHMQDIGPQMNKARHIQSKVSRFGSYYKATNRL